MHMNTAYKYHDSYHNACCKTCIKTNYRYVLEHTGVML